MRFPRRSTATAPRAYVYECVCGATQHSLDNRIPVGWSILKSAPLCPDCTGNAPRRAKRSTR